MHIKEKFEEEGFVLIRNLIRDELILNVLNSLEKFKKKNKYYYTQSNHNWVRSSKITKEGYLIDSIQSPTKQKNCGELKFAVEETISSEEISKILREINGNDKFINWQNMLFDRSTGTIDHADTWYLDTKPRGKMIAAWIALEDIKKSAGRFYVYPRSHKLDIKENINQKIKDNYSYSKFMREFIKKNNLKFYAPDMRKGDVLFWHPFTIHGSSSQKVEKYSRKSLTAHYHPIGMGRIDTAENPKQIDRYIRKMRPSSNSSIYFDNSDPTDFEFTNISFMKWLIKKLLRKESLLKFRSMDREIINK
mgnify:CR=1 FL=1